MSKRSLLALACASLSLGTVFAQSAPANIDVMTRNHYVGADLFRLVETSDFNSNVSRARPQSRHRVPDHVQGRVADRDGTRPRRHACALARADRDDPVQGLLFASVSRVGRLQPRVQNGQVHAIGEAVRVMASTRSNQSPSDARVADIVSFREALSEPFRTQHMPRLPPTPGDLID